MPQTEEEHLENQNLDYEDMDRNHPDAEVSGIPLFRDCPIFLFIPSLVWLFFISFMVPNDILNRLILFENYLETKKTNERTHYNYYIT